MPSTIEQLPAILGGNPVVTLDQTDALRWPIITQQDENAVLDVLRSGKLSLHPIVHELEEDFKGLTGRKFAQTHNNGTAAILAGLHAIGIQPFDEVIVPSATWWSSVMPILHCGGVPATASSDSEPILFEQRVLQMRCLKTSRNLVRAHAFGHLCNTGDCCRHGC